MAKEETRGRPSKLTGEVLTEIRELLLCGRSEKEIIEELEIPRSTWFTWRHDNYEDFRTNVLDWRKEYKLSLADRVSDEILLAPAVNEEGKADTSLLSIKQKEAQFLRETLDKKQYSKRTEMSGTEGRELPTPIINLNILKDVSGNNSITQDTTTEEED